MIKLESLAILPYFTRMNWLFKKRIWPIQSPEVVDDPAIRRAFFARVFSILEGDPAKVEKHLLDLIYEFKSHLYSTNMDRVLQGIASELLSHDEERQLKIFLFTGTLSDLALGKVLTRLMIASPYLEVQIQAMQSVALIQSSLIRILVHRFNMGVVRRGVSSRDRKVRNHHVRLIEYLPIRYRLKIYSIIFRSSYRYHNAQLRTIQTMSSLSDELKIKLVKRIMSLRDADEKMILETLDLLPGLKEKNREAMLLMMMKNAPYDQVVLQIIESIQIVPPGKRSENLYRIGARNLLDVIQSEDDDLRMYAVSLISRFPVEDRFRLIQKALEGYHRDAGLAALRNILSLPVDQKVRLIQIALKRSESIDSEKNTLSQTIKLISLVDQKLRPPLYALASARMEEYLEAVLKNSYYYNHLNLLASLPYFPESSEKDRLMDRGKRAVQKVLEDNKKNAQILAVRSIQYLPEDSMSLLIQKALESEYDEVIGSIRYVLDRIAHHLSSALEPFYIERICRGQILEELRTYDLPTIYERLSKSRSQKVLHVFPYLNEIRVFSVFELYRYLKRATLEFGIATPALIERMEQEIRSDNERIGVLFDFLYAGSETLRRAPKSVMKSFYRIAKTRLRVREKGLSGDLAAILEEYRKGNVPLPSERSLIEAYLKEEGIRTFDFLIYSQYRALDVSRRKEFTSVIQELTASILNGKNFSDIRIQMERSGLSSRVNQEFIFAVLIQLLPIESSHLPRTDAKKIFFDALKLEGEILSDLPRISPELTQSDKATGISVVYPSVEMIFTQSRSYPFSEIPELLKKSTLPSSALDPGSLYDILHVKSRGELYSRLEAYIIYSLRDQLEEIYRRFQSMKTRYEALNALQDLMSETFHDVIRTGVNQLKQEHSRDAILLLLKEVSHHLDIPLPLTNYIGRIRPGAVVRYLKESYLRKGKTLEDFLRDNIMYVDSPSSKILSWNKLISFLRRKSNNPYYDPDLADSLEHLVYGLESGSYTARVESVVNTGDRDPFTVLLNHAMDQTWSGIFHELREGIRSFDTKEEIPGPDTVYRIGKSAWLSIFGGLADICIARDTRLFARDNFTLVSMVQEERYVGFNLVHMVQEGNEKILVLAGCEPANFFASRHSPGQIYEEVVAVLERMGRIAGFSKVVQIADENAFSNRDKIKQYIKHRVARGKPDGYLRKALYLGSYGATTFRAQAYYLLRDLQN